MSAAPILSVNGLDAGYDFLQVLWDVNLHVSAGEFVALVGPNGAGKTTTLRALAGLLPAMRGEITFRGARLNGLAAHRVARLGISYVSETLNLFPAMTVYENLLLGAYTLRDKARRQASLDLVFQLFPRLAERRGQLAGTLSGGERKMLAIARGIMPSPALMLVDEPSLGLAPMLTLAVFETLVTLRQHGVTILLVEQNVNTTLRMVDRAYVLEQGRVVQTGRGPDLLNDPHIQAAYLGI
jgi:branched-chain amino acid transport system ATP-binding protein